MNKYVYVFVFKPPVDFAKDGEFKVTVHDILAKTQFPTKYSRGSLRDILRTYTFPSIEDYRQLDTIIKVIGVNALDLKRDLEI